MSVKTDLGKVSITPKGAWSSSTAYSFLDLVTNNSASYLALKSVTAGTALTNTEYWMCIVNDKVVKTTMDSVAVAGCCYFLGTQTTVSVVLPSTASSTVGQEISVVFYSGSTATTLTVTGTTIGTVPTPTTSQRVELNFLFDGTYWSLVSNTQAVTE